MTVSAGEFRCCFLLSGQAGGTCWHMAIQFACLPNECRSQAASADARLPADDTKVLISTFVQYIRTQNYDLIKAAREFGRSAKLDRQVD